MDRAVVLLIVIAAGILALGAVGWLFWRKRRSDRLRGRFGPEYERTVRRIGDRGKAEAELEARTKRVEKLKLRPLTNEEQDRFGAAWDAAQARFVDDPKGAVADADRLVKEVLHARGYPVADFEQRAADISVDHPKVVANYRTARDIARRCAEGKATTEDLRKAVLAYRELFAELLEAWQVAGVAR